MSSSLPLSSNPLFPNRSQLIPTDSPTNYTHNIYSLLSFSIIPKYSIQYTPKSHICYAFDDKSNYQLEEARWLREEQRWLREEQRWLREEQRWNAERQSLIGEIETLKLKIKEMEQGDSQNLSVLKMLKNKEVNQIAERGTSAVPLVVETTEEEVEVVVKEVVRVLEGGNEKFDDVVKKKGKVMLRKGSEGEAVRVMQEALQKLGFYCGDEDSEYSMFSSGTERAVKTWQATLHVPEDGIMTAELLEKLYLGQKSPGSTVKAVERNDAAILKKEVTNGAAVTSVTEILETQQRVVKAEGVADTDVTRNRVFLLGENRWEDPSRLVRNKKVGGDPNRDATTKCLSCRGEGQLLCAECDGTGEPNIEEQFMEWVDEGSKCPYCEGLGHTICDVCDGKKVN